MSLSDLAPAWLGRALRAAGQDVSNLLSLVIFFSVTAFAFRSVEFALVVTASLGFHELGHAAALIFYRQTCRIHFGLVGAWTWSDAARRARLSQISNAYIHLAGPFFSLLLALLALAIHRLWLPGDRHLLILANFSAQVGFLNLLPLGPITDGGKIIHRMMRSLDGQGRRRRRKAIWLPVILAALMLAAYGVVQLTHLPAGEDAYRVGAFVAGLLLAGLWLSGSMLLEAPRRSGHRVEKPQDAAPPAPSQQASAPVPQAQAPGLIPVTGAARDPRTRPTPMRAGQVTLLTLLVFDMLALYLLIIAITPFWLEPDYVRGGLLNLLALVEFIFGQM